MILVDSKQIVGRKSKWFESLTSKYREKMVFELKFAFWEVVFVHMRLFYFDFDCFCLFFLSDSGFVVRCMSIFCLVK